VYSIVIADIKSASAAAYALAHCSSHRTLPPEKNVLPLLGARAAYQNASLDISNFAQTRAEGALAVARRISPVWKK